MPLLLSIAGLILIVVALLIDPLGIGQSTNTFGWVQIVMTVVGIVLLAIGLVWRRRR